MGEPATDKTFQMQASRTITMIEDLNSIWEPHSGQQPIGYELFVVGKKLIFIECGRKFGKTEMIIYILYRWAMTTPNGAFYYIAPFKEQARKLIWDTGRIQGFLKGKKDKYVLKINDSRMIVWFKNKSFIQLDGADNFEAHRGTNPHGIVYEEAKDHKPQFHKIMGPNLATHEAPLVVIGTGEEFENTEGTFHKLSKEAMENLEGDSHYFNMPSWYNPHISRQWLLKEKRKLIRRGEYDVWLREYAAKRVRGGSGLIFPMLKTGKWEAIEGEVPRLITPSEHFKYYDDVIMELKRIRKRLDFYCTADPASASCFGILFTAVDRFSRKPYHLDNLYVKDQRHMSTKPMANKINTILNEIDDNLRVDFHEWTFTYDEAAAWWNNEMVNEFNWFWTPTKKRKGKNKLDGLSLVKDQLLEELWCATDRCHDLMIEKNSYSKDKNGKIPDKDDHLIDCERYLNEAAGLDTVEEDDNSKNRHNTEESDDRHRETLQEAADELIENDDWAEQVEGGYYD